MTSPQKATSRDLQTNPFVMIPKVFFTRFKPSIAEIGTYTSLKYFATTRTGTTEFTPVPTMAELAGISVRTFQRAIRTLVKKGAVRVKHRSRRMPSGQRMSLPNLYEIIDLKLSESSDDALI